MPPMDEVYDVIFDDNEKYENIYDLIFGKIKMSP